MKKIILTEKQINSIYLFESLKNEGKDNIDKLKTLIEKCGTRMYNKVNGDIYFVYELFDINGMPGYGNCLCREIKNGKAAGPILIKNKDIFDFIYQ